MATILEYACLSQDVYTDDENGINKNGNYIPKSNLINSTWVGITKLNAEIKAFETQASDFFARVYGNKFTNETVIAYRGTSLGDLGDLEADKKLAFKEWNPQDTDALRYYLWTKNLLNNQKGTNYSKFPKVTGHSLGGYLAQLVAVRYSDTKAIVFNAPKIGMFNDPRVGFVNPADPKYKNNIFNYDLDTDYIHLVGVKIGKQQMIKGDILCEAFEGSYDITLNLLSPLIKYNLIGAALCGSYIEHSIDTVVNRIASNTKIATQVID